VKSTHTVGQMLMDLTVLPPGKSGMHVVELPYNSYGIIFRGPDAPALVNHVARYIEGLISAVNVAAPAKNTHATADENGRGP